MKSGSSLNRKLVIGTIVMLSFSLLLSVSLIHIFNESYQRADRNLAGLSRFRQVLIAANRLSAERGPTNAVLGEEPGVDSASRRKLADFRAQSDAALDAIGYVAAEPFEVRIVRSELVEVVRQHLRRARADVDALAGLPRSERSLERMTAVIGEMFDVIDDMRPAVSAAIVNLSATDQSLAGPAIMAQMLGELREYAGRLGSLVMPSVASMRPLTIAGDIEVQKTLGRIHEIWQLAERQAGLYPGEAALIEARNEINTLYFGHGLPLIEATITAGHASGDYGMTTAELTDGYVPTLAPIERLRAAILDLTVQQPRQIRDQALNWLILVSVFTGLIVLANVAFIIAARKFVLRPLLTAKEHIIALSEGTATESFASPTRANEVRHLFDALEELRRQLGERILYTERLKVLADTDGLTGLTNRRTFDRIGRGDPEFSDVPLEVGLILIDIDHFKQVNDTYGHLAGDQVLRCAADLIRAHVSPEDIVARYGGEELAIVVAAGADEPVKALAETIRAALARTPVKLDDGNEIFVTASFGVAAGHRDINAWVRCVHAADAALYRAKLKGRNCVCTDGSLLRTDLAA